MNKTQNRRTFLLRMSMATVAAAMPGITVADRSMLVEAAGRSRHTSCDNAGVPISDIESRIVSPEDFTDASSCKLSEASVEGPYFVCTDTETGKNLVGGRPGQPLTVALRVLDKTCKPIPNAIVDVWCCDAEGNYSGHDVDPDSTEIPRGRREPDLPERFLRGVLATDGEGIVEFDMIYPGFYAMRAVHLHFKVHVGNKDFLTSQALFPEAMNEKIMAMEPYNSPRSTKRVLNAEDPRFIGNAGEFKVFEKGSVLAGVINLSIDV